jgi:hypothetical protein
VRIRSALVAVVALAAVPAAAGSVPVSAGTSAPTLRVDAAGNAEVSWSAQGERHTALFRPTGVRASAPGLAGPDVSQPVRGTHIPFQRVLRSAPGGWYYALQARPVGGRGELAFSRWQGVPTEVILNAEIVPHGIRLSGHATLDGKRLLAKTAAHMHARLEVRVEGVWRPLTTVTLSSTGAYAKLVAASGERTYRVIVGGPGLAPDAAAVTRAIEIDPGR